MNCCRAFNLASISDISAEWSIGPESAVFRDKTCIYSLIPRLHWSLGESTPPQALVIGGEYSPLVCYTYHIMYKIQW